MGFQITKIILWPRKVEFEPRIVPFLKGYVNVITGSQAKGKSSILWIIDYCLASSECRIPVGVRKYVSWFGIVLSDNRKEILLARRSPGEGDESGEMYLAQGKTISIPLMVEKTMDFTAAKLYLNKVFKLDFWQDKDLSGGNPFPSFRDTVSFNFQPQYLIANQSTLFYKADSFRHRKKLKDIFPYIIGAITDEALLLGEQQRELETEIKTLEKELLIARKRLESNIAEVRGMYFKAQEFGLIENTNNSDELVEIRDYMVFLKRIIPHVDEFGLPSNIVGETNKITTRLKELRKEEFDLANHLFEQRSRLGNLKRISILTERAVDDSLTIRQRTKSIPWFLKRLDENNLCPFCGSKSTIASKNLQQLIFKTENIIGSIGSVNDNKLLFQSEIIRIESEITKIEKNLSLTRRELKELHSSKGEEKKFLQTSEQIFRFLGELSVRVKNIEIDNDLEKIELELRELLLKKSTIEKRIAEIENKNTLHSLIETLSDNIHRIVSFLKAEGTENKLTLNIENLTLDFNPPTGKKYSLWEIGSGANYLSYHIGVILALHHQFLKDKNPHIMTVAIFDQPSQVFFPDEDTVSEEVGGDHEKVKKLFEAFSRFVASKNGNFQIIVLEHAGERAWANLKKVHLVERWRDEDKALIPNSWMQ